MTDSRDPSPALTRTQAQERADRIRAFREEMCDLERERVLLLSPDQAALLTRFHEEKLAELARRFDVDTTDASRQLSWGLRITSFLGAMALSAAVYFFFFRFWGLLATPSQVAALLAAPLAGLLATEIAARREKTLYIASLTALVAFAAFVLNLSVLGETFNLAPTANAFLACSAFAFLVAYAYGLRVLLVAGIGCLMIYLAASTASWTGEHWLTFGQRPENFILAGAAIFGLGCLAPHRRHDGFPPLYRLSGLLAAFVPILILAGSGDATYLPLGAKSVETLYQIAGFPLAGAAVWLGIRRRWAEVTYLGSASFVALLLIRFFDWWWDWMPKYLFFLLLGLVAILVLLVLGRLKRMLGRVIA